MEVENVASAGMHNNTALKDVEVDTEIIRDIEDRRPSGVVTWTANTLWY